MIFQTLEVFQKDLKKLSKKYPTLVTDIEVVKKVLVLHPEAKPPFSFVLQGLGIETPIIKIKKIASRSLWQGSAIRFSSCVCLLPRRRPHRFH